MGGPEDDGEEDDEDGGEGEGGATMSPMQSQRRGKIQPSSGGLFGLRTNAGHQAYTHTHTRLPESSGHGQSLSAKGLLVDEDSVGVTSTSSNSLNNRYALNDGYAFEGDAETTMTLETGTNSDHLSLPTGGSLSSVDGTEGGLGLGQGGGGGVGLG